MSAQPTDYSGGGFHSSWKAETLWVTAIAAVATLVMTWPLPARFFTQIAGPGVSADPYITLWDFWWFRDPRHWFPHLYQCDWQFFPLGTTLAYHGCVLLYVFVTAPIGWLLGIIPAINSICLVTFVTSALACYWLCRTLGIGRSGSWLAAMVFAFSPDRLWRLQNHTNFLATDWLAAYGVCLMVMLRARRGWLVGVATGVCMAGTLYCDYTFAVLLVILSLLYVAVFFRPRKSPETSKQIVLGLGVAAVVAIALASPLLLALRAAHANYQTYVAEQYDSKYADVLGFLFPPESSLLWRWVGWTEPKEKLSQEGVTFLGYMASVIGLIALFSRAPDRRFTFWKIVFAVFLVLSLGAYLTVGREMDLFEFKDASSHRAFRLTLPYAFLSYIPLINNARGAVRFHAITSLAFAVLVAFGFSVITARGRWAQRRVAGAGLIAAFTLAEYAAVPIQTFRPQLEAFYAVRNDPDDVSVLDGLLNAREPLLHQVGHRKRNIVGHASRIPPEITGYVTGTPLLREFAGQALATPANVAAFRKRSDAPTIVADIADLLDLRYFVIDGEKDRFKRGLFDDYVPYRLVSAKDAIEVYRIEAPPRTGLRPGRIAVGEGAWSAYLGHGWGQWIRFTEPLEDRSAVWPVSPRETVFFKAGRSCDVAFDCDVYCPPGYDGVQVSVRIRGNEIARQTVPPGFSTVAAQVPATEVRAGLNEIEICWPPGSGTPVWDKCAEALPRLYFISGRLENEVRCAVLNIEGQRNWIVGRGYWLIQLSDDGRRTRDAKLFDPYADAAAWRNLVAYVDAIPEGRLVAFLAAFEASKDLPEEAVAALGRLGSAFDMRGKKGWGHAGLGIKGMQPGQAIEHAGSTPIGFAPGKCAFTEFRFREASQ